MKSLKSNNECLACFADIRPIDDSHFLAFSDNQNSGKEISHQQMAVLASCSTLKTIDAHAEVLVRNNLRVFLNRESDGKRQALSSRVVRSLLGYLQRQGAELPLRKRDLAAVKQQLMNFASEGLLSKESEIRKALYDIADSSVLTECPKIEYIAVPTANRPLLLNRMISTVAANLCEHGRSASFLIMDDSDDQVMRGQNLANLCELRKKYNSFEFYYADESDRLQYAKVLADHSQLPLDLIDFAIAGKSAYKYREGAMRNSILLSTLGKLCLMLDDDIVCKITLIPPASKGKLALAQYQDSYEQWFFEDYDAALKSAKQEWLNVDLLAAYEQFLGKTVANCLASTKTGNCNICLDSLTGQLFRHICQPNARVKLCFLGSLGDTGGYDIGNRLLLDGDSFHRLVDDEKSFAKKLVSRCALRGPTNSAISSVDFCQTMNVALDNRQWLPPFMPVLRVLDVVFGTILPICDKDSCSAYLPYALFHEPPKRREEINLHILKEGALILAETNSIFSFIIGQFPICSDMKELAFSESYFEDNLIRLGQYLADKGNLSGRDFDRWLQLYFRKRQYHLIERAQIRLEIVGNNPKWWADQMRIYIAALRRSLSSGHIPYDLPGKPEQKLTEFQHLIGQFGLLLMRWPEIVAAAKELTDKGIFIAKKIRPARLSTPRKTDVTSLHKKKSSCV